MKRQKFSERIFVLNSASRKSKLSSETSSETCFTDIMHQKLVIKLHRLFLDIVLTHHDDTF